MTCTPYHTRMAVQSASGAPSSTGAREAILAMEGRRLWNAFLHDPLLAINATRMNPLPHQLEMVYGRLSKIPPDTASGI